MGLSKKIHGLTLGGGVIPKDTHDDWMMCRAIRGNATSATPHKQDKLNQLIDLALTVFVLKANHFM